MLSLQREWWGSFASFAFKTCAVLSPHTGSFLQEEVTRRAAACARGPPDVSRQAEGTGMRRAQLKHSNRGSRGTGIVFTAGTARRDLELLKPSSPPSSRERNDLLGVN